MVGNKIIIAFLAVVVAIGGLLVLSSSLPGEYDQFAQCLSDRNTTMYGAYWCSHCLTQKKMFGNSFKFVNYVECDGQGPNGKPQLCQEKGVKGYPTWEIMGKMYEGQQNLATLSAITGCPLTSSAPK